MKRKWIGIGIAVAVLIGVVAAPKPQTAVSVATMVLEPRRVEQTVTCNGAIEAGESQGVFAPLSCVISEVIVRVGQQVKAGDVLATVDKDATRQLIENDRELQLLLAAMQEEIRADADGIVVAVKAKAGEILDFTSPCAVIAPRESLQVRVTIREKDLRRLRTDMAVRVSGDGFGQATYEGTLTDIASTATASGNGSVVEGVITLKKGQADETLRIGLTAKAAVITKIVEKGLVVPYEAVLSDEQGDYVYLLKDGCARRTDLRATTQLKEGLLLADTALQGAVVVLQPEKITADGIAVNGEEAK